MFIQSISKNIFWVSGVLLLTACGLNEQFPDLEPGTDLISSEPANPNPLARRATCQGGSFEINAFFDKDGPQAEKPSDPSEGLDDPSYVKITRETEFIIHPGDCPPSLNPVGTGFRVTIGNWQLNCDSPLVESGRYSCEEPIAGLWSWGRSLKWRGTFHDPSELDPQGSMGLPPDSVVIDFERTSQNFIVKDTPCQGVAHFPKPGENAQIVPVYDDDSGEYLGDQLHVVWPQVEMIDLSPEPDIDQNCHLL